MPATADLVPIKVVTQSSDLSQILLRLPNDIERQLAVATFIGLNATVVSDLCQIR